MQEQTLKVRKNKPLPVRGNCNPKLYPFDSMEVGDSFEVKVGSRDLKAMVCMLISNAKRYGIKVSTRKLAKGRKVGVWRVA